jgi:hypothetical protein
MVVLLAVSIALFGRFLLTKALLNPLEFAIAILFFLEVSNDDPEQGNRKDDQNYPKHSAPRIGPV